MSRTMKGIAGAAALVTAFALGSVVHVSTPRSAPASGALVSHVASAKAAEAKVALLKYLKNSKPSALIVRRSGLHPGHTMVRNTICVTNACSYNWSGYASSSSTKQEYSTINAQWTVLSVTCTAEQQLSSQWVGLDGLTNNTVEQAGTLEWCFQGTAFYYTWWEMYPASAATVGTTAKPGDIIFGKIARTGTSYTLSVTDSTTSGNSFSVKQTCALATCTDKSAEWIDERPSYATTGIVPLADTADWNVYGGTTTAGGKADTIATAPASIQLSMTDSTGTYYLNSVSALASSGKSFSAHWLNSF
jgi:hypothetical protein